MWDKRWENNEILNSKPYVLYHSTVTFYDQND